MGTMIPLSERSESMMSQGAPSRRPRHATPDRRARRRGGGAGVVALAALAVVAVGGTGAVVGAMAMASADDTSGAASSSPVTVPPAPSPNGANGSADASLPSRPTMLARVVRVDTGEEVTVDVGGRTLPIRILGIDAPDDARPAQCGSAETLAFADQRMSGQMVTLVPDPTVPELDEQGRRLAYVVLRTQLSYTDAALMAGVARVEKSRALWYSDVFAKEQTEAAAARRGIWGDPCRANPAG